MIAPLEARVSQAEGAANAATGRGTPNGPSLVADMVAINISAASTTNQARTTAKARAAVAKHHVAAKVIAHARPLALRNIAVRNIHS